MYKEKTPSWLIKAKVLLSIVKRKHNILILFSKISHRTLIRSIILKNWNFLGVPVVFCNIPHNYFYNILTQYFFQFEFCQGHSFSIFLSSFWSALNRVATNRIVVLVVWIDMNRFSDFLKVEGRWETVCLQKVRQKETVLLFYE